MTTTTATMSSKTKRLSRVMSPVKKSDKQAAMVTDLTSEDPPPPEKEFSGTIKVSQKLPSKADLARVADLPVLDKDGKSHTFGSLYANPNGQASRVLVLFIRHFFCGQCQEYIRTFSASVLPTSLTPLNPPTSVVIIGCGQPSLISFYADATACPFPIYADPTKKLYIELGMGRTLDLGPERRDYIQKSLAGVVWSSFVQTIGSGRKIFKGGDYWQVGGEFLFETEAPTEPIRKTLETRVKLCHRMTSTRDHAGVPEVRRWLGLDEMPAPAITFRAPTPAPEAVLKTDNSEAAKSEGSETLKKAEPKKDGDRQDAKKNQEKEIERPSLKKRWTLSGSSESIRKSSDAVRRSLSIGRGSDGGRRWSRSRSRGATEEHDVKEETEDEAVAVTEVTA